MKPCQTMFGLKVFQYLFTIESFYKMNELSELDEIIVKMRI